MKKVDVAADLLDPSAVKQARQAMASILVSIRSTQRRRPVADDLRAAVTALQPGAYMWHWQAWRMGGFERQNTVGVTADGHVLVIKPHEVLYGNPLTEEVVRIVPEPRVKPKYSVH